MSDALEAIEATAARAAAANPRETAQITAMMKAVASLLKPFVEQRIEERVAAERADMTREIAALRAEIAELRNKGGSGLNYVGVWQPQPATPYTRNTAVTWEGSMFVCMADTTDTKPGVEGSDWRLCVKRGRDGRDAPSLKSRHHGTATPRETP